MKRAPIIGTGVKDHTAPAMNGAKWQTSGLPVLRSKTFKGATCADVDAVYALYKRLVALNTPE
jgi:hypothetical protein